MSPYRVATFVPPALPAKARRRARVQLLAVARVVAIVVLAIVFFPFVVFGVMLAVAQERYEQKRRWWS